MSRAQHLARNYRRGESGYALLMVIFLVASMILMASVAAPRLLTEGRREKEAELVWRGKQYERAIRLYYQKNGRYPSTIEDLSKPSNTGAYFLRKIYKDPTNAEDGSWRMIYVTPSGQLVGSVNYFSLQDMAAKQGLGIAPGSSANPLAPQQSAAATAPTSSGTPQDQQSIPQGAAAQPAQPGQPSPPSGQAVQPPQPPQGTAQDASASAFGQSATPGQLQAVDGPVLGGFVIGVGSKVKKDSIEVYQGADNYAKWEFIWNPLTVAATPGQAAPAAATGQTPTGVGGIGLPGSSAAGGMGGILPGNPTSTPNPSPTQSNPQQ